MTEQPDKRVEDGSELPLHRVAVVVFANAPGLDYSDAGHAAQRAVARALRGAEVERNVLLFEQDSYATVWRVPVEVADVVELSIAASCGYVGVMPTTKAYRQRRVRAGSMPESMMAGWDPGRDG